MINFLQDIDSYVLLFFNGLNSPWADTFFYLVSNRFIWIPLYVVLLFFLIKKWRKKSIPIVLAVILCITLTDQTCNLIKNSVQRPRPSHNAELCEKVHLYMEKDGTYYKGGAYGFPSSHAANSIVLAWFVIIFLRNNKKWPVIGMFAWVLLLSYSRMYLGVHYLSDLITGWLIGTLYAGLLFWIGPKIYRHFKMRKDNLAENNSKKLR